MDRKRTHKTPIVEKFERNPLSDFTPGLFIPTFRLYGLDKTTNDVTVTCYNEAEYIERRAGLIKKDEKDNRLGCEIRLSETSPKAVNIRHQCERRLAQKLHELNRHEHAVLREVEFEKQRIKHENSMKVKRVSLPLSQLQIPGWRHSDVMCKCVLGNGTYCPVHMKSVNTQNMIPPPPKSKNSYSYDSSDDDYDDSDSVCSSEPDAFRNKGSGVNFGKLLKQPMGTRHLNNTSAKSKVSSAKTKSVGFKR